NNDKVNFGSASMVFEDEEQVGATFILPRGESPLPIEPSRPDLKIIKSDDEVPTDAVSVERPMSPPPPEPLRQASPPSRPTPVATPMAPPPPPPPRAAAPPPPPPSAAAPAPPA